jgi:molecular chaperone GrpE
MKKNTKKHEEVSRESEQLVEEQEMNDPASHNEKSEVADAVTSAADELAEAKDKYLRLYSEFDNFRRRTAKERIELIATASRDLMENLLPILDDFERAIQSAQNEKATIDSVKQGMDLIQQKMTKALESKGLKRMQIQKGDDFNPELHEAITQIPADPSLEGKIVDVVEPGYAINETVIRFAKVVIGAKQ